MEETIGNMILCILIVASGILFVTVNVNYTPNEEDKKKEAQKDHDQS